MNNENLDKLLDELKKREIDDIGLFSNKTGIDLRTCSLMMNKLVEDGYAQFGRLNRNMIGITPKGNLFQGYIEEEKQNKIINSNEEKTKELDKKLKQLSIENLEYEKTIRDLKYKLLLGSVIKNYWWLLTSSFALGAAISAILF
ncbi:MAG: hypothetical protein ACOZCO_10865 [Bacteroidota bacterium]